VPETTPASPDRETVYRVKQAATPRLLAIPNVVAVGIGPKIVGGQAVGQPAIKVFIRRKLPADQVPADELIPPMIDGVPTDVEVGGEPVPVAVPVDQPGAIGVLDVRTRPSVASTKLRPDLATYRTPGLIGGAQLTSVGSQAHGTLGCLLWDPANHDVGYALTNMHVVQAPDLSPVTKDVSKVGQPDGVDCSKKCCNDVIGTFAGGGRGADRDEALVKLSPGLKWQAQIKDIGLVAGTDTLDQTKDQVHGGMKYPVAKRGRTTGVTGGWINAVDATSHETDNLLIIAPNPNPDASGGEITFFDIEGDSGSAVVNKDNKVVGLLYARDDQGNGYAYHIDHVLARLKTTDHITVAVATTTDPAEVHTVPGAAFTAVPRELAEQIAADPAEQMAFTGADGRAPVGRPWFADIPPKPPTTARVRGDLAASASGRMLLALWENHQQELTALIDRDRRVTVAWHRGGGAALIQLLLRLPAKSDRALPATLSGRPLMTAVDELHTVLARGASAPLRTDLERARTLLPDLGGLTYPQIVAALDAREIVDA